MKEKFFYQPDFPTTIICWSYTFIILLLGFILWLEITFFQVWTLLALLVFLAVAALQIVLRKVELTQDELILHTVIPQNAKKFRLNDIENVSRKRAKLSIQTKYQTYSFFVKPSSGEKLYNSLNR
ncbi:pore-forming protein [Liquorilactobacillus sucicola DSM 21376 = JCM 15457]|uniref:Pore-forming protein n=1 Tax=Liquorilactobacillus sucicola DSM 21376 = JCM 15457 TaxID=1423806 RepID=A0A023CX89_9LACO|nr:EbsA family protein [Liquorilactobacillus sucicola]KRN06209.1 hypothetical protein FD15_GL001405 [Liquorilactobacillus sucicola DSM 21376 = JCM 15457]GAJ26140.1 pore-forming protein [Liquorilactobacillus sucicola DSM 21376 = JCM 15457]